MTTKRPPHVIENLRLLHEESRALLESVADRLPPEHVDQYRTLSNVGEWRELVEIRRAAAATSSPTPCAAAVARRPE